MINFYSNPVSNFCAKVSIVLQLKGVSFIEQPPPGGYGSSSYKALVPSGTIPAIVDDGLVLSESETINEYLEEIQPDPALLPSDPRERARARLLARLHDSRVEPPLRALFGQMAPATRDQTVIEARIGEFGARMDEIARLATPSPWLIGQMLTLADIAYAPTLLMGGVMLEALGRPMPMPAALQPWHERLLAEPRFAATLTAQRAATHAWLVSKGAV